ncbi:hypothetical protein [Rothia koreensis]|uniref:hypothetical protein n=1 Tax=Rothia koreensis TaxID=592378 RepID=UPI003FCE883D
MRTRNQKRRPSYNHRDAPKWAKIFAACVVGFVFLSIVAACLSTPDSDTSSKSTKSTPEKTHESSTPSKSSEAPKSEKTHFTSGDPDPALKTRVESALKSTNTDATFDDYNAADNSIWINYEVSDTHFTNKGMVKGARADTAAILEELRDKNIDVSSVNITGNLGSSIAFSVVYNEDTIMNHDWFTMPNEQVWAVRDGGTVNPTFVNG